MDQVDQTGKGAAMSRGGDLSLSRRLAGHVPLLSWARRYRRGWIRADVVAGLTVWGLVVPEGMAYAGIAGLPVQAGLYTVLVSLFAYAVLGTSRQLVVVATSATAALVGSTVVALKPSDTGSAVAYASALVLMVGLLFLLAGLARFGFVAQFLSRPVLEGFVVGVAVFVAVSQLGKLFGVSEGTGSTPERLWQVVRQLGSANWWAFAVGAVALAALFLLPRLSRRLPAGLLVLAGGIALSAAADLAGRGGVEVVGELPRGLPSVGLPSVGVGSLWALLPAGLGIMLVGYSEALGVAESMADRHGYDIAPDQELLAFGAANLASGAVGGMVACGGMSASAVNDGSGARSQLSGVTAGVMAVVTVLLLTPLFQDLPVAVLAALIIHAVTPLMSVARLKAVYRLSRSEFWLGVTALGGVVLLDVLQGLVIALLASLLLVTYRSTRPGVVVLGELPGHPGTWSALRRNPDARTVDGILVLRLDAPMYYANAAANREAVKRLVESASPPVRTVVLDPEVQHQLDVTSIETVQQLVGWLHHRGIDVYVVHVHQDLMARALRVGLGSLTTADHVADTPAEAVARAVRRLAPRPRKPSPAPPDRAASPRSPDRAT